MKKTQLFVAFPWVETSTGPGGFMICVFINMTGTPEGSTESGFIDSRLLHKTTIWNEWALCYVYKQKLHKTTCSEWKEMLYNDVRFQMA